jgi:hypothetical protein
MINMTNDADEAARAGRSAERQAGALAKIVLIH